MKAMTRAELAARAGVSVTTLRRWLAMHPEIGLTRGILIPPDKVRKICEIFDIDI